MHLADTVTVVALCDTDLPRNGVLESDARQKPMKEVGTAIMGQRLAAKVDDQIARAFGHCAEPYPMGRVRRKHSNPLSATFYWLKDACSSHVYA
jgi:hypothetical protein